MKHVIIIETPDEYDDKEFVVDRERFKEIIETTVEALADNLAKISVVRAVFFVPSAIDTVLEMYGTNRVALATVDAHSVVGHAMTGWPQEEKLK